jgi:hypothetical protein
MLLALFLQNSPDPEQIQRMALALVPVFLIMMLLGVAIVIIPFWFICKKAGFSPWLSLLNIIPLGGVILWYVLAFSEWKVVPAPQAAWSPQPPYPPQPPYQPNV